MTITRLIGVYRADGGLRGELRYLANHYLRGEHCSLCDITHSALRRKPDFDRGVAGLGVPFVLLHLNELEPALAAHVGDRAALVVADTSEGYVDLFTNDELAEMHGDVHAFIAALQERLAPAYASE